MAQMEKNLPATQEVMVKVKVEVYQSEGGNRAGSILKAGLHLRSDCGL